MKKYIRKNILDDKNIKLIVIGASAGGLEALKTIISKLDKDITVPIVIVQHISPLAKNYSVGLLGILTELSVKEAEMTDKIKEATIYLAPPNYHVLVELDGSLSLSTDEKVNFSRPSIDVLFESAADAYREHLAGIILTGANSDGAEGLQKIGDYGGLTIVQKDPKVPSMVESAKRIARIDLELSLEEIANTINKLGGRYENIGKN